VSDHPNGQDVLTGGIKMCTLCRKKLPLESFTAKPHLSSGRDSWCRTCRAENLRAWRAKRKAAAAPTLTRGSSRPHGGPG
jgi:hypothetical protein